MHLEEWVKPFFGNFGKLIKHKKAIKAEMDVFRTITNLQIRISEKKKFKASALIFNFLHLLKTIFNKFNIFKCRYEILTLFPNYTYLLTIKNYCKVKKIYLQELLPIYQFLTKQK